MGFFKVAIRVQHSSCSNIRFRRHHRQQLNVYAMLNINYPLRKCTAFFKTRYKWSQMSCFHVNIVRLREIVKTLLVINVYLDTTAINWKLEFKNPLWIRYYSCRFTRRHHFNMPRIITIHFSYIMFLRTVLIAIWKLFVLQLNIYLYTEIISCLRVT